MIAKVFISSTEMDLGEYRREARDAALKTGFHPVMFEHWPASGDRVPLEACKQAVLDCDLLLVIVAYRYGWVPPGRRMKGTRVSLGWNANGPSLLARK